MCSAGIRLVTFDVTGTLLKFRKSPGKQYYEVGKMFGISSSEKRLDENFAKEWKVMIKSYPNFGKNDIGWEKWWKILIFKTFNQKELCGTKELNDVSHYLLESYKTLTCWKVADGAHDLLTYLRTCDNLTIGVISNSDTRLHDTLKHCKLNQYFDFILSSYEAGFEKPNKRIFSQAMKLSKVCNLMSEDCLHIGDKIETDYIGAKNAGWKAILLEANKKCKSECVTSNESEIFSNLVELHQTLKKNKGFI